MIDHVWTVVCSRGVIDNESNNVSIQNVIEQITPRREPSPDVGVPIRMMVVSFWVRSEPDMPARGFARLSLGFPSGETSLIHENLEIDLSQHERFRTRIHIQRLLAREAGRHYFCTEYRDVKGAEWRQVASVPLMLRFEPPKLGDAPDQ